MMGKALDTSNERKRFSSEWLLLGVMIAAYLALFFYFYPCTQGIDDEVGFINEAIVWSKGAMSAEGAGFSGMMDFVEVNGRHVAWRNPGRPLLILPFLVLFGIKSIYISGALIHIGLALATGFILVRLKISPLYAVLTLGHPTLALYSRTIMGDAPAALGLLLALLAVLYAKRPGWWAGAAIGCAALMRYQSGFVLPFFALAIGLSPHILNRKREAIHCAAAGALIGGVIAAYNMLMFGNLTGWVGQGFFHSSFILQNGIFYGVALILIWPGMLLVPFLDRSPLRWAVMSVCVPLLILLLPYYFHDRAPSFLHTLVIGQRLLQPALPAWILSYAIVLDKKAVGLRRALPRPALRACVAVICLSCVFGLAAMFSAHQSHLLNLKDARDWISREVPEGSLIIANQTLAKLFGVPREGVPHYRWRSFRDSVALEDNAALIEAEKKPWYLAALLKSPGESPPDFFGPYLARYRMLRVPSQRPDLILYRSLSKDELESRRISDHLFPISLYPVIRK